MILTSSLDLAQKIQKMTVEFSKFMQIDCPASIGKMDMGDDISTLSNGQQFVVGTPSRILALTHLHAITTDSIKLFVLDEADKMLSCGFTEHIYAIYRLLPEFTQVVLLSVTMPHDLLAFASGLMHDHLHIIVKQTEHPLDGNKQFYIAVEEENGKFDILSSLNEILADTQKVIFCNTRRQVEWLANELTAYGFTISTMHGDMTAIERAVVMEDFQSGTSRLLLATNLLARGIDVQQSWLVVNYHLPAKYEDYFHRTGSSRRVRRNGVTINLITAAEVYEVRDIEHYYNTQIEEIPIPLPARSSFPVQQQVVRDISGGILQRRLTCQAFDDARVAKSD